MTTYSKRNSAKNVLRNDLVKGIIYKPIAFIKRYLHLLHANPGITLNNITEHDR